MSSVSADKIIGKSLIARKTVKVYNLPDGSVFGEVKPNGFVGQVYSYITRPSGLWWQLIGGKYVKHETGAFQQTDEIRTAQDIYRIQQDVEKRKAKGAAERDIVVHLEKLAAISESNPGFFKTLLGMLNGM